MRQTTVRLTFPGRREGVSRFGETWVVFAAQASSITEGVCRPCGVGGPSGEQAVAASSVDQQWAGDADRRVSDRK